MVKYITNINNNILTFDTNGTLGAPGIKTSTIEHTIHGFGSSGQVITSDGNGGWGWNTPTQTQSITEINDLSDAQTYNNSIYIGSFAGSSVNGGDHNIAVGVSASLSNVSGEQNIAVGHESLYNNLASYIIAIGHQSGYNNIYGSLNTFIGNSSGLSNTYGFYNVAIGDNTLESNQTGEYNTSVGWGSNRYTTAGSNTAIGASALYQNATGGNNVAIGNEAFRCIGQTGDFLHTSGNISQSIAIGKNAGRNALNNSNCIYIGYNALSSSDTADNEIVIGNSVTGAGSNTVTIGNSSTTELYIPGLHSSANSGDVLTFDGTKLTLSTPALGGASAINDLSDAQTYNNSIYFGSGAGSSVNGGDHNIAVGVSASLSNVSGSKTIAIGHESLYNNTTSNIIAIGYRSGYSNTTGIYNTFIGNLSGISNTDGSYNTSIGDNTLETNLNGSYNTSVGWGSNKYTTAASNTAVGSLALYSNTTGGNNVAIGGGAFRGVGQSNDPTATAIISRSIAIGKNAGRNALNNSNCIYIGYDALSSSDTADNEIVIGNSVTGAGSNTITLGDTNITELHIPGLHSGASSGDVLTFDGSKINLSTLPANSGTVVEPFAVSSIGGLFTLTSLTGYYTMFHTYIDVEFSRISLYTMSDTSAASGTIVAGVFSNLSFAPNTSLSQATYSFTNVTGVTEIIIDFSTVQLSPHTKYWLGISVQTTSGTLYLAKSAIGSTDNYFALSENNTFNGTTLSAPVSPSPSSFNFYYRLHRPNAPGGILSNSTTVPTAIEVAHAVHKNDTSTQNITSFTNYTKILFDTTGHYSHPNFTIDIPNSTITVLTDGLFSVSFTVTTQLNNSSSRTTTSIALHINGSEFNKSIVRTYNRLEPQSDDTAGYTHIGYYPAGTFFDIRIKLDDGSGPITVKDNGNQLTVMKLSN